MYTLLGAVLMYWGMVMLDQNHEINSPFAFFGGVLLLGLGAYVFGISLAMPLDSGRAWG